VRRGVQAGSVRPAGAKFGVSPVELSAPWTSTGRRLVTPYTSLTTWFRTPIRGPTQEAAGRLGAHPPCVGNTQTKRLSVSTMWQRRRRQRRRAAAHAGDGECGRGP
jgi:hypothetical protein